MVTTSLLLLLTLLSGSLESDSERFRQLRQIKGHFQGSTWNAESDAWNGAKHQVMERLREQLVGASHTRVETLLGPPDRRLHPGDSGWSQLQTEPLDQEALVYEWRGRHDFLYFLVQRERVVRSAWWMAYE